MEASVRKPVRWWCALARGDDLSGRVLIVVFDLVALRMPRSRINLAIRSLSTIRPCSRRRAALILRRPLQHDQHPVSTLHQALVPVIEPFGDRWRRATLVSSVGIRVKRPSLPVLRDGVGSSWLFAVVLVGWSPGRR